MASHQNNSVNKLEFLPRIAQADKTAAHEFIDVYGAMIWALAKQSVNSNEAVEKAVEEIFTDIWENAAFCDLTVSDGEVWIVMIARRRLAKYLSENHFPIYSADIFHQEQNSRTVA